MKTSKSDIQAILSRPYARLVIPDVDGSFSAEIVEFPGCFASGDTAAEALEILEEVAAEWLATSLEQGQEIPEPMDSVGYSGKLVLRMPKSLHQKATLYAERDGVSLNQFIVAGLAEQIGIRAQAKPLPIQFAQTVYAPVLMVQLLPGTISAQQGHSSQTVFGPLVATTQLPATYRGLAHA